MASIGGGGYDCPVVGPGGGGYVQGGGFLQWTHLSQDCNDRKMAAEVIAPTLGNQAAVDWMYHQNSEFRDWYNGYVKRASTQQPASAPLPAAGQVRPAWETK